jgi:hypothetical protein
MKWQWRSVGLTSGAFCAILAFESRHQLPAASGWFLVMFFVVLALSGFWLASGSVITNANGITKRTFWRSCSLRWADITGVHLARKDGGAIEVSAGTRKLVVDSRFSGFQHLLAEIEEHIKLKSRGD